MRLLALIILPSLAASAEDLKQLVAEALESNPEIQSAARRYASMRWKPAQAAALPDPTLSAGYQSTGSPRPFAGIGRDPVANAGFSFTQEFPAPGKRKLRGEVALKEVEAEREQMESVRLSVIARVKQAYHRLHHTYASAGVLERNRDVLRRILELAEARYAAGRAPQPEVFKLQTQLSVVETRLEQLVRERRMREAELSALLNRPPGSRIAPPEPPEPAALITPLAELEARVRDRAPAVVREQKLIERSDAAIRLAGRNFIPDMAVSGGYFNMGSMADMYMFRLDVKLPIYRKKLHAEVAGQTEALAESRHNLEAARRALEYRVEEDYAIAQSAVKLIRLYESTVVPQATHALESALAGYQTGSGELASVLTNSITILEFELAIHEEMEKFFSALARMEEATGGEEIR